MKAVLALVLLVLALPLEVRASEIDTLVEQIKQTKNTSRGISSEEEEVARRLQHIGPETIPYLLPLLQDPNPNVRDAAAYTLRDMSGLKEEHLSALIDEYKRDDGGWIPPAIATIGTLKAVDFLFEELVRVREAENQLGWAIHKLGSGAVPRLIRLLERKDVWDDRLARAIDIILRDLGPEASGAVDPLVKIMNDETMPMPRRIHAAYTLGIMGPTGAPAVPELLKKLRSPSADLGKTAVAAIVRMRVEASVPFMLKRLQTEEAANLPYVLYSIAELHSRGTAAGPTVRKYLTSNIAEVRACAARTLGYLCDRDSGPNLLPLLNDQTDWRVTLCVVEALGQLEVKAALPKLTKISQEHWYPPVRAAAATAVVAIRDGVHPESPFGEGNFFSEYFAYQNAGAEMETITEEESSRLKLPLTASKTQIPESALKANEGDPSGGRHCGIKIDDGYLLGRDEGEFGGEIKFVDHHGKSRLVAKIDTEAIYQTSHGIIAVTGLAHININDGNIYKLEKNRTGQWQLHLWRILPGAPRFSRLLKDGSLFVNCHCGMVLISPDGGMKSLSRKDVLDDDSLGTSTGREAN